MQVHPPKTVFGANLLEGSLIWIESYLFNLKVIWLRITVRQFTRSFFNLSERDSKI